MHFRLVLAIIVVFVDGFTVVGVVSIQVWQFSNSMAFCVTTCHDVHPQEREAYSDSFHARAKCVECHMGRVSTLRHIALKTSHGKHLPQAIFGAYHRPVESESMRPAS